MIDLLQHFNQELLLSIYSLSRQSPILDNIMVFGADYIILVILLMAFFLNFRKNDKYKKALLLSVISIGIIFLIFKLISQFWIEPRPYHDLPINPLIAQVQAPSFPSRHTTVLVILALSYGFYRSRFAILIITATIWTGFARVFVGVHYPFDILGGLFFGILAVLLSFKINNRIVKKLFKD